MFTLTPPIIPLPLPTEFVVDCIVDEFGAGRGIMYLVKWKGYELNIGDGDNVKVGDIGDGDNGG